MRTVPRLPLLMARLLKYPAGRDGSEPDPTRGGGVHQFDDFTVDTQTRRLLRNGEERHLSPKAFGLLVLLIDNRARALSKTELHEKLWPSTYVLETNLAGLVAEIRQALGDSAAEPRYVRTVHRFGYWFIGSIHGETSAAPVVRSPVKYWLIWETRQVPLSEGSNILGRAPDAEVWIDALGVSRHHARITLSGADATVEDLGSKNGTYVGGTRLTTPCRLSDGDQIRLGSVVITFRVPPPTGSTETTSH
jgi:DNA-binding winged helix-turn-helix (wHTH) protein